MNIKECLYIKSVKKKGVQYNIIIRGIILGKLLLQKYFIITIKFQEFYNYRL